MIAEGGALPRPLDMSTHRHFRHRLVTALASAALVLTGTGATVLGHEGDARLILEPDRVSPGGVLTIRIEDLPPERPVELSIVGSSGSVPLSSVVVDPDGHATVYVDIPIDLPVGTYAVTARADGVDVAPAHVLVHGQPIQAAGEPGAKDEDDMLLIPLPSGWQQSVSGPIVTARPLTETLPAGSATQPSIAGIPVAIAVAVALGSVVLVLGLRPRPRV
jgi:hypothetical protein